METLLLVGLWSSFWYCLKNSSIIEKIGLLKKFCHPDDFASDKSLWLLPCGDLVNYELFVWSQLSAQYFYCSSVSGDGDGGSEVAGECLLYLGIPGIQQGGGGRHSDTEISAIPPWTWPGLTTIFYCLHQTITDDCPALQEPGGRSSPVIGGDKCEI